VLLQFGKESHPERGRQLTAAGDDSAVVGSKQLQDQGFPHKSGCQIWSGFRHLLSEI